MACIYIPVQNSEEEVRVALDQLPRDATDILDILKAEQAPLDLWLIIAREYFKQGKIDQFIQILEEGSSTDIDEYYADVKYERIAILNALGAYYSYMWKSETDEKNKDEYFRQATKHYNKASRIDVHESSTWVGKGQLLLAKGELDQAFNAFKIVLDGDRDNVAALLGQACVHFTRGKYADSLELYKRALHVYPLIPIVRVGIGLCHYKLGRLEKAKQAFYRVLELDPESIDALVALGILDLQTNEAAGIRNGMKKMQRAFEIYPLCANSLNYLANHFFFTGQHFLVEQLTEAALSVTVHGPTKAHSYYNLARSYHSKGDYEQARKHYMRSVAESGNPHDFVLPYYGLGQVQLKLGDWGSALSNFEKVLEVQPENCETLKALGYIYDQHGQSDKAKDLYRKATKINPQDPQAFLDLGELLMSMDINAALDAYKTAFNLMKRGNEEIPLNLFNNMGVLHFERGELELASEMFKEALGEGIWCNFWDAKKESIVGKGHTETNLTAQNPMIMNFISQPLKGLQLFQQIEEQGLPVELPWYKVSILFNLGRVLEQMHNKELASALYHLILFKHPEYTDAHLRLAAIKKAGNDVQMSLEHIGNALNVDEKCVDALLMRGDLELKKDDWVKAKETLRMAKDLTGEKDFYAAVCLGNWNYFAANRNEKRAPKLESTHYEKAKELYTKVLQQQPANLYAANGAGMVFAEKGQFDIAKELFTQVQEAASGSSNFQMPDVWINLAHVHFAQGNFALAVKMYENCLRRFYNNTDSQVLLYLARTHYEAEQWQECKKTLLRAIHLAPSNYTLRFNAGVALQKFSASTLQKTKRTLDELRATVTELRNAVRLFSMLSSASNLHSHGFDEKKIETHVAYCGHILKAAVVHCDLAEREEMQNIQRMEVMRQMELADESRRKAEEQRKVQMEKRKLEDERKQVLQQEKNLERIKEQWKHSSSGSKRKEKHHADNDDGGRSEKRRRRGGGGGGKRRKRDRKAQYDSDEGDAVLGDHDAADYKESYKGHRDYWYKDKADVEDKDVSQGLLAAAGLEDSDVEDAPADVRWRKRVWSDSDEEAAEAVDMQASDGEGNGAGRAADDEE